MESLVNNFKTVDPSNWRKGRCFEFTIDEHNGIKSIVDNSTINPYLSKYSKPQILICLLFDTKRLKTTDINIVDVTIQKTDYCFSVLLKEYTGDRDYARYDKTNEFLYEFSYQDLKLFLTELVEKINQL